MNLLDNGPDDLLFLGGTAEAKYVIFDPFFGGTIKRESLFVKAKCGRVVVSAAVDRDRWMFDMKHFVKHHVFDNETGRFRRVERTADHDLILRRVVVAEHTKRFSHGPRQIRPADRIAKILDVDVFEDLVQVVNVTVWQQRRLSAPDFFRSCYSALNDRCLETRVVCFMMNTGSPLTVKLGNQNKGQCPLALELHVNTNVRNSNEGTAAADPDRVIYAGIWVDLDRNRGNSARFVIQPKSLLVKPANRTNLWAFLRVFHG